MTDERTTAVVRRRALIILGLTGLAVTQPVLGLFGDNPEFFVAGNYTKAQIVIYALVVALVPAAAGTLIVTVGSLIGRRAGSAAFGAVVGVLATALALVVSHTLGVDRAVAVAPLAVGAGAGVAYLVVTTRAAQLFCTYVAVANLWFVGAFLFVSPASDLVVGDDPALARGAAEIGEVEGPLVVVVLDELPASTIVAGDGTLNTERYPGFGRLAEVSTWFRNASSPEHETQRAVPTILTGTQVDPDSLPTYADHPRNMFTMLGAELPVHRFEAVTNMCPAAICEPQPPRPLRQALRDTSVVYGHRVLPDELRDGLPAIDNSWGDFGGGGATGIGGGTPDGRTLMEDRFFAITEDEQGALGQAAMLSREIEAIDGRPGVHYVHVLLPHSPWSLSRTGVSTTGLWGPGVLDEEANTPGHAFRVRLQHQLHAMQVGAVDVLVGELVDHLTSLPDWDDTMLVVTADHGISFTPPDLGRKAVTDTNREEVLRVPLFIKVPGQTGGDRRDDSVQTLDILPSIVDVLDVEVDDVWQFDGHSLFDRSASHTAPAVSTDVGAGIAVAAAQAEEFPHGDDWLGLAAVGEDGDLVGRRVEDLDVGEPSDYSASLDDEHLLDDLPTEAGTMPFVLAGTVSGARDTAQPPELLAAVNGTLAGVVGGYRPRDEGWRFLGYVADLYVDGANEVELYEVERRGRNVVLHAVGPG